MNSRIEIRRQIFHLVIGAIVLFLLYFSVIDAVHLFVVCILGFLTGLVYRKMDIPVIKFFIDNFERPHLRKRFPGKGALFLFLGFTLAAALFPKDIALAAIAVLVVGDSVSHLTGKYYGSIPHPLNQNKIFEGTILGVFGGFLAAMLFVNPVEAFLASFVAMIFEAFEIELWKKTNVDDNILIPVIAGVVIVLLRTIGV